MSMEPYIFYSWQSDTSNAINRGLIRKALELALKDPELKLTIEDSLRVESGMENSSGSPEVATVMFQKISKASIVLADVTLVGETTTDQPKKKLANPNVLIELGYAAGLVGWERIICVMNEAYGERTEQPFDIRNRRFPINYKLPIDAGSDLKEKVLLELSKWIKEAVSGVMKFENLLVESAIRKLDVDSVKILRSLGNNDYFAEPTQTTPTLFGQLEINRFHNTIERLLDLGMVWVNVSPNGSTYGYYLTHMGATILKKWGIRTK